MKHHKNICKKATNFVVLLVEDIKISDIFFKIQNFLGTALASIITTTPANLLISFCFQTPSIK